MMESNLAPKGCSAARLRQSFMLLLLRMSPYAYAYRTCKHFCAYTCVVRVNLAPVVQRPDNFIQWISHYPTVSICAKISVFPHEQANMHTLTTA